MTHIANIFVGDIFSDFIQQVIQRTASQYILPGELRQFCRFYNIVKDQEPSVSVTEFSASSDSPLEELTINKDTAVIESQEAMQDFWNGVHTDMVQVGTASATADLRVFIYVCLHNHDNCLAATSLAESLKHIKGKTFTVDFVAFDADLIHAVFDASSPISAKEKVCEENRKFFVDFEADEQFRGVKNRFFVIQNNALNGKSYHFDLPTLADIISEFMLMAVENYDNIFPLVVQPGKNTGIGLSRLSLDKAYFVKYLMRKAYIKVLDDEGIQQTQVDRTTIDPVVQDILLPNVDVFSLFYDKHVVPLLERNMPHDQIIAAVTPKLKKHFEELEKKFTAFLSNDSNITKADGTPLTIPEKQAALALLLDIDDSLITGAPYADNPLTIDDIYSQAANIFIEGNNGLVTSITNEEGKTTGFIPGPLEKPVDETTQNAFYPLPMLKAIKREILATTENIRKWERQLEGTEELRKAEELAKRRLTKDGFEFGGMVFKLMGKTVDQPFKEVFDATSVKPLKAVDLRPFFTEVKSQGSVGSCAHFSVTSIYEYLLKKSKAEDPDLSERFVYFQTNVATQKEEDGSSIKEVIDTIARTGVCNEQDCPYDTEKIAERPSDEAFSKAQMHKIVEAKMVNVCHHDITAALSKGYPLAVSLNLYNSFGTGYKGYEFLPTKEEMEAEEPAHHAMVVVGYNEDDKVYIVRNSWGKQFGDNGYCYMPFSYIDNPDLNNYCCIITKTDDGEAIGLPEEKTTVNLVKEDVLIRNALLRIKIDETKLELERLMEKYRIQQSLFIQLIHELETTRIRKEITEGVNSVTNAKINEAKQKRDELKHRFTAEMDDERQHCNKQILYGVLASLLFALLTFVVYWFQLGETPFWVFTIALSLAVIATTMFIADKKHRLDKRRKHLNDAIARLALQVDQLEREKKVINLKHHLAAMIIDEISSLKSNLKKKYENTVSYVRNISLWYTEQKEYFEQMDCTTHIPIIGLLDNATLDRYFLQHGDDIMRDVRFSDYLSTYDMDDEKIVRFRDSLRDKVAQRLRDVVNDFSIIRFLHQPEAFPYIDGSKYNMRSLLPRMNDLSLPFFRPESVSAALTPSLAIFHSKDDQNTAAMTPFFSNPPTFIPMFSADKLVLISTIEFYE